MITVYVVGVYNCYASVMRLNVSMGKNVFHIHVHENQPYLLFFLPNIIQHNNR
jgi:hypothetical protein